MQIKYIVQFDTNYFYVIEVKNNERRAKFFSKASAEAVCSMLNFGELKFISDAAKEQRKGRAKLSPRSSLDNSPEGIDCEANKYLT